MSRGQLLGRGGSNGQLLGRLSWSATEESHTEYLYTIVYFSFLQAFTLIIQREERDEAVDFNCTCVSVMFLFSVCFFA